MDWFNTLSCTVYLTIVFTGGLPPKVVRVYKVISLIYLILTASWGIIGYLLSGNLRFMFENNSGFTGNDLASYYFWIISAALIVLPLFTILIYVTHVFVIKSENNSINVIQN